MTKKKNKKPLIERLQKYEQLIAGTALFIGVGLFAGFIIAFLINTKAELDSFKIRTSSTYWQNSDYGQTGYSANKITYGNSPQGTVIIEKFCIFNGVYITADSHGTSVLVDDDNKKVGQAVFISDGGERITATSTSAGVEFDTGEYNIYKFAVDGYYFEAVDSVIKIDGYLLSTYGDVKITETTTTAPYETETSPTFTDTETGTGTTDVGGSVTSTTLTSHGETGTRPSQTTTSQTTTPHSKPQTTTTTAPKKPKPQTTTTTTAKKPETTTTTTAEYKTDDEFVKEVLRLVNFERKKAGLSELKGLIALDKAATIRANEITGADENFSHTRPNGKKWHTVLAEVKFSPNSAGENLAAGQSTPEMVVSDWMASEGHKANILDPDFVYAGLGYVKYDGYYYWAQIFASN